MTKRKEIRQQRKLEKESKKAEKIAKYKQSLLKDVPSQTPKFKVLPDTEKEPKVHNGIIPLSDVKQPKKGTACSRFSLNMSWCANYADVADSWSWGESRNWHESEWTDEILPGLNHMAQLLWREIDQMSSDTGHKMHHGHEIADLCQEAQDRWCHNNLEQFGEVFRFRLGNKKRAWGIIIHAHFHLVWYERYHNIYPT